MRYWIIIFMLVCGTCWACDYCIDHPGEKELQNEGKRLLISTSKLLPSEYEDDLLAIKREHLILLRHINAVEKQAKHNADTQDKICSMIADLGVKDKRDASMYYNAGWERCAEYYKNREIK